MLTSDAKKVLYTLYSEYKTRRSVGSPKADAKLFHSAQSIHENFLTDWCLSDVEDVLRELGRFGFVDNFYADDTIYICNLSDSAIATMENLPTEILLNVVDFVTKFIP